MGDFKDIVLFYHVALFSPASHNRLVFVFLLHIPLCPVIFSPPHLSIFISIPSASFLPLSPLQLTSTSPYLFCLHYLSLSFPFSLSLSYLKPYGVIVTMCEFDDYSGSSVRLLRNFTTTHRGANGRHTCSDKHLHHARDDSRQKTQVSKTKRKQIQSISSQFMSSRWMFSYYVFFKRQ